MAVEPEMNAEGPGQILGSNLIGLTGPSETIAVYQLAARWAERYADPQDDLRAMLERFHQAYVYLDAVTHGMEPPNA